MDTTDDLPFPVMDVNGSEMFILVTIIQTGHDGLKEYWTMTHEHITSKNLQLHNLYVNLKVSVIIWTSLYWMKTGL